MHLRYNYRLRVSAKAERMLQAEWSLARWIWNECVAMSQSKHALKEECGPAQLDKMLTAARGQNEWLRAGTSVVQQQTIRDFGKSRSKALKDIKNLLPMRQRAGMPKFKSRKRSLPTLNYTHSAFRVKDGRLCLSKGIVIPVVWSRELPSAPKSVRVYQDSLGHWYASFVVDVEQTLLPLTGAVIGIDWGVKEIATTTSDEHDLPHPEYGRKAAVRLARYQRQQARRARRQGRRLAGVQSRGYKQATRMAAKLHKKVARQRQDDSRKWAKSITQDFDILAVEDFKPNFLAKSTMARKAADAAIGAAKRELITMAGKHGREVRLVNPAYTTMDCGSCGARAKHKLLLSERTYVCTNCGVVSPRDKNSALVMLIRAGLNPASADRIRLDEPQARYAA
jgi:putative transposase